MGEKIFISYRRDDSKADSRSLYQRLEQTFGSDRLFMDVDSIETGRDFSQDLNSALAESKALVAVIGPRWLTIMGQDGQPRIRDPGDYVHREIATALDRNVHIVPVLIDGASMPRPDQLPPKLAAFATKQATRVTHENFTSDVERLERHLDKLVPSRRTKQRSILLRLIVVAVVAVAGAIGVWRYLEWRRIATAAAACPALANAKTPVATTAAARVTFTNRKPQPIRLFWLDTAGKHVFYQDIPAGESRTQESYLGHLWVVTDAARKCLGIFNVDASGREFVIR